MKLSGNTVVITGGATGIGFGMAESFLKRGNTVIICGRRESKLLEAQKKLPGLHIKVCDVSSSADREDLVKWLAEYFSDVNVLVNNAGIQRDIDFTKGIEDLVNGGDEIKINLEGPVYLSALMIPLLKGKKEAAIVNVSSGIAFRLSDTMPMYATTKAALHAFSLVLRKQLSKIGIKVFEIIPPMILDTELNLEGRAKARAARAAAGIDEKVLFANIKIPSSAEFAEAVIADMGNDKLEIGYGSSEEWRKATREQLGTDI